ncbi:hypothetical protein TNCV_1268271 [Trichonephila clavipes]|nr:hypothetical protein TNCV_1268271 [Trichonephila clavipes]
MPCAVNYRPLRGWSVSVTALRSPWGASRRKRYVADPSKIWNLASAPTRGLLATDLVILNHGQVTWMTPELAPPLPTTTPHQREDDFLSEADCFIPEHPTTAFDEHRSHRRI